MEPSIAANIDRTIGRLQEWVGRFVIVETSLSRAADFAHERHFTTKTRLSMRLEFVGARLSGSALMFHGVQNGEKTLHEVSLDVAQVLEFVPPDAWAIVERFGPALERRTRIWVRPLGGQPSNHMGHCDD